MGRSGVPELHWEQGLTGPWQVSELLFLTGLFPELWSFALL